MPKRILCLDPTGVLGKLPSPVLFPEYGDRILHVAALDGPYAAQVSEFAYGNFERNLPEDKEIWLLWPSSGERFLLEKTSQAVQERFQGITSITMFCILFEGVESGAEQAAFFDPHREVIGMSGLLSSAKTKSFWKTAVFGLAAGSTATGQGLARALALRFWMTRESVATSWVEPHYRVFFRAEISGKLLEVIFSRWELAYSELAQEKQRLLEQPAESQFFADPELLQCAFPEKPSCWPSLSGWKGRLGWLYTESDLTRVRTWLDGITGEPGKAIESAWSESEQRFQEESSRLFSSEQRLVEKSQQTPAQAEVHFRQKLAELETDIFDHQDGKRGLLESLQQSQSLWISQFAKAVRCRPTHRMLFGCLGLTVMASLPIAWPHLDYPASMTGVPSVGGWIWWLGYAIILCLASIWALVWSQFSVLGQEKLVVRSIDEFWNAANAGFRQHLQSLGGKLRRVVASRNYDLARTETVLRQRRLEQTTYHLERLANYLMVFSGRKPMPSAEEKGSPALDVSQHEARLPVYWWGASYSGIRVHGYSQPGHMVDTELTDDRLAGLQSIELRCVAPEGRRLDPEIA